MRNFTDKQAVKVTQAEHPLFEKIGDVRRIRMGDNGAWVRMREPIPDDMTAFNDDRKNDVVLYPEQCEPA